MHCSPSPQVAAASPTPTELETETLSASPAPPVSVALASRETHASITAQDPLETEPMNAPTCEDATYLCKCVRKINGTQFRCLCLTDSVDEGWCADCWSTGLCECGCDACDWRLVLPVLMQPVLMVLPDLPRELRNLQPSTGVRVALRGDAILPKYDPSLERAQRGGGDLPFSATLPGSDSGG